MQITVNYYAQFADLTGRQSETLDINHSSPRLVYEALKAKYDLPLAFDAIQVAVNHKLSQHNADLSENDLIAFLPPMTGG